MRLSPDDIASIKSAAQEVFGPGAVVRLFGSRRFDELDGGDLDLHVEVDATDDTQHRLHNLRRRLWAKLPYDKIDVLVSRRGVAARGFERIAYRDGIVL
ncbi:hypothetical protein [Blastomonas sp.]|uniref:hypothetical protein n=1 Tax=Blastomonas sp. TaxID=1909299 RepID=UPI00391CA21B